MGSDCSSSWPLYTCYFFHILCSIQRVRSNDIYDERVASAL